MTRELRNRAQDDGYLIVKPWLDAAEHRIHSAFADVEGKPVLKQLAQSLIADGMDKPQVKRQR
jgi:hypothetical protein